MERRKRLALILFFAMITAALAPTAFRLGVNHSAAASETTRDGLALSQNDAATLATSRVLSAQDCFDLGTPSVVSRPWAEIDCLQAKKGSSPVGPTKTAAAPSTASKASPPKKGRLAELTSKAIAETTLGNTGILGKGLTQADPPEATWFNDGGSRQSGLSKNYIPGVTAGIAPPMRGPADEPTGNAPENRSPNPFDMPFDDPTDEIAQGPADLVTPLPSGLVLMLTGLIGFYTAVRFK